MVSELQEWDIFGWWKNTDNGKDWLWKSWKNRNAALDDDDDHEGDKKRQQNCKRNVDDVIIIK